MPKTRNNELTDRQQEIFDFILSCIAVKYPPTLSEIADYFGFSGKAAHDHLIALEKKGKIERIAHSPRCIRILGDSDTGIDTLMPSEILTLEITSEMRVKAEGFKVGEFIRLRRQPYGVSGDVVLVNANGLLMLHRLKGDVRGILGKVVGHTIPKDVWHRIPSV